MGTREAAADATRARILEEAQALFLERWYDEVTIALVAEQSDVSGQTVLNHFGDKEHLFAAAVERAGAELDGRRDRARAGDIPGSIGVLVDDYEIMGDANIRLLAVEERLPLARAVMDRGRDTHRVWIERIFGASPRTTELLAVTDVYVWKLLRRDQGLGRDETFAVMVSMVEAVLARPSKKTRT